MRFVQLTANQSIRAGVRNAVYPSKRDQTSINSDSSSAVVE